MRNRAAALESERNNTKFGSSLSRSRSAQSLKLLGDTATQVSKKNMYLYNTKQNKMCTHVKNNLIFILFSHDWRTYDFTYYISTS